MRFAHTILHYGEFHGDMMGHSFTGHYLLGFDNSKQKFKSVWVDDFNTAIHTSEGKAENDNKVITLEGKMDCPATGQKDITTKHVYRVQNADTYVLEMYNDGKRAMEITYTRQCRAFKSTGTVSGRSLCLDCNGRRTVVWRFQPYQRVFCRAYAGPW